MKTQSAARTVLASAGALEVFARLCAVLGVVLAVLRLVALHRLRVAAVVVAEAAEDAAAAHATLRTHMHGVRSPLALRIELCTRTGFG